MRRILTLVAALAFAAPAAAAVKTQEVAYEHGGVKLKGLLAWDDAATGKRPGVLVVHEWWGLDEFEKGRAVELAKLGYVAFACDMYGEGKLAKHPDDARAMATEARKDVEKWRGRAQAGLKVLQDSDKVDATKLAAIGYCFGGSTCLQLAASGADLKAVATFHAALPPLTVEDAKKIKAKVLVNHGADDTFISKESIDKFLAAMKEAMVNVKFDSYPGTVHSFSVPDADKRMMKGMAYNKQADEKSWAAMKELFKETLK
jgi:dienelactone hydrolase